MQQGIETVVLINLFYLITLTHFQQRFFPSPSFSCLNLRHKMTLEQTSKNHQEQQENNSDMHYSYCKYLYYTCCSITVQQQQE